MAMRETESTETFVLTNAVEIRPPAALKITGTTIDSAIDHMMRIASIFAGLSSETAAILAQVSVQDKRSLGPEGD